MGLKEFGELARRTEINGYAEVVERLKHPLVMSKLKGLLGKFIKLSDELDEIKKHIVYGKEVDFKEMLADCIKRFPSEVSEVEDPQPTEEQARLLHGLLGMAGESGEALKPLFDNMFHGEEIDWVNVGEEALGDTPWYQFGIVGDMVEMKTGNPAPAWLQKVINKLKVRYPNKFSSEDALNRNLDEERKTLES